MYSRTQQVILLLSEDNELVNLIGFLKKFEESTLDFHRKLTKLNKIHFSLIFENLGFCGVT